MKTLDGIPIKDCIGCGFCCTKAKCDVANRIYPSAEKCPELKWNGDRHTCGLMDKAGLLGERYRQELYAGEGCCMGLNSWRREPLQDRTPQAVSITDNPIPSIMQTFLAALGKQWISGDTLQLTMYQYAAMLEKDGMSTNEAKAITNRCIAYINNQKSSFAKEFMG